MTCPVCSKPTVADYRPFCSRRCADIDLGRWFNEDYRIPTDDSGDDEDRGQGTPGDENDRRGALAH